MPEIAEPIVDRAWDVGEVARYTHHTPRFIYYEIEKGHLRACRIGGSIRIFPKDLQAWINAGENIKEV